MEPMVPQQQTVEQIHEKIAQCTGKRLKVRANMGRSKIIELEGVLKEVHPSLFVVEVDVKRGRKATQSYQYVDILTGTVELTDVATGMPLFEDFNEN